MVWSCFLLDSCQSFYYFCGMCKLSLRLKRYVAEKFCFNKRKILWQLTNTYIIQHILCIGGIYLSMRSFQDVCLCLNGRRSDRLRENFYFSKFPSFCLISPYELLKCICRFPKIHFNRSRCKNHPLLTMTRSYVSFYAFYHLFWSLISFLMFLIIIFCFVLFFLVFFCCIIFIYQLNSLPHKLFLQLVLGVSR